MSEPLPTPYVELEPTLDGQAEAGLVAVFLRGCQKCVLPHPRVRGIDSDTCECGEVLGGPEETMAKDTVITGGGFRLTIAKKLLGAAKRLNDLARRL